jgi:hypothetical protein
LTELLRVVDVERCELVASAKRLYASTVTTKPGGTGNPACVISPRFAPLPPTRPISAFVVCSNQRT